MDLEIKLSLTDSMKKKISKKCFEVAPPFLNNEMEKIIYEILDEIGIDTNTTEKISINDMSDAIAELNKELEAERRAREYALTNLLDILDHLNNYMSMTRTRSVDTDGDPDDFVFTYYTDNEGAKGVSHSTLGYVIDCIFSITKNFIVKENENSMYVYILFKDHIFEVGRMVGQGTYEYINLINTDMLDKHDFQIINFKIIYNEYMSVKDN